MSKKIAAPVAEPSEQYLNDLRLMPLYGIARQVRKYWPKVYFGAEPYLDAMGALISIKEKYGADTGESVCIYFLSNAATWRGPYAKAIKAELKRRLAGAA